MAELPVVAYDGSITGYQATKPAAGSKIDPNSAVVNRYVSLLQARHTAALKNAGVGAARVLYEYYYSYNGFSAKLTAAQANKLAAQPGVISITPNEIVTVDTSDTPSFLGLTGPD